MARSQEYIFNRKLLKKAVDGFNKSTIENLEDKIKILDTWKRAIESDGFYKTKETAIDSRFLMDIFRDALGYKGQIASPEKWNLSREQKTKKDATRADGALGFFTSKKTDIRAVIELKDIKTDLDAKQHRKDDKRTPVEQAFEYSHKSGTKCKWVIVSNYKEIRLYHSDSSGEYEGFDITELADDKDEFKRFYFLLSFDNLLSKNKKSRIETLYKNNEAEEEAISKRFYSQYKQLRLNLFEHIKLNNPQYDEILLLEKTQKLLDRFVFIWFCEDTDNLLPTNICRSIIKNAEDSFSVSENKVWNELKGLFKAIDKGYPRQDINAFNGGLFAEDAILDSDALKIKDEILKELVEVSDYDFESDLSVNILGHIFEQSISDLEELRAKINGQDTKSQIGKRKKDGIFYTPEYITRYIVENSVGAWLEERKKELGIDTLPELAEDYHKSIEIVKIRASKGKGYKRFGKAKAAVKFRYNKDVQKHVTFWEAYKEKLMNIKVLDPACGSGAFLNQTFDFLYKEGQLVNEKLVDFRLGQSEFFDLDKHILSNNLYGVDLNRESVEITKLSLWIKTANKHSQLTALDDNIKCGNSLIDDPEVAADKAFDWEKEFPDIMKDGGFDVVVGNPPYVRQEALGAYKPYFSANYDSYTSHSDLFVYFYEKGLGILNKQGYLGFISNTFAKTTGAGSKLRSFLKNNSSFVSLIDFSDIQIFKDAITYPIIPILRKEKRPSRFQYLKVKPEYLQNLELGKMTDSISVKQADLKDEYWTFESEAEQKLKAKIRRHPTVKESFGKCYRGILTGFNEAFIISEQKRKEIISKSPQEAEIIKPYFEGKDLKKWFSSDVEKWLILFPREFTIERTNETITEKEGWEFIKKSYPEISSHLVQYREKAKKRYDKGNFWWELRACSYYNLFESPKISWPNLQAINKFSYDEEGFYINAPSVILATDNKALLCIVNSKLAWFFFLDICVVRSGGYIEMKPQYFEQLPVLLPDDEQPFIEKADMVLAQNQELQNLQTGLIKFLQSELKPQKITKKLENWTNLDWNGFKKELAKGKVKIKDLSFDELQKWHDYFESKKAEANTIQQTISQTDNEINQMVYDLYGLTEEEIKIVEEAL